MAGGEKSQLQEVNINRIDILSCSHAYGNGSPETFNYYCDLLESYLGTNLTVSTIGRLVCLAYKSRKSDV